MITSAWSFPRRPICPMRTQSRNPRGPYRRRPLWRRRPVRAGAIIARRAGGRLQGVGSGGNPRRPGARGASHSERVLGRTSLEVVRRRRANPWCQTLRDRLRELGETDQERATLLRRSVDLPPGVLDSDEGGDRPHGVRAEAVAPSLGRQGRCEGAGQRDKAGRFAAQGRRRRRVEACRRRTRQRDAPKGTRARWDAFARSVGIPDGGQRSTAIEFCRSMLAACDAARARRNCCRRLLRRRST